MTHCFLFDIIAAGRDELMIENYTASDFINADITVNSVRMAEHAVSTSWARPKKYPRDCEGLLYFVSGEIEYYFEGYTFRARPGQVVKLPSGNPYNGKKIGDDPLEIYLIDFYAPEGEFYKFPIPDSYYPSDSKRVIRSFEEIIDLTHRGTVCAQLECKNALSVFLCSLAKDFAVDNCHYDDRSRILQMCEYIRRNFRDSRFHISDASAHFHVSDAHFRRIFAQELHISPLEYLTSLRIELAKNMLIGHSDMNISQIAYECGYSSVYYFSSAFKAETGITPSKYRRMMHGADTT